MIQKPQNPLVVALDVDSTAVALRVVDQLHGLAGMFKIGKQLFTAAGPDFVRQVLARGEQVFLDLKFHDIPSTVAKAAIEATRLGVSILNVHALGGKEMMNVTAAAVKEYAEREQIVAPQILGVTVLTSHSATTLRELGITRSLEEQVVFLAEQCAAAGLDGVVASPQEIAPIRRAVSAPAFTILTPGVRPAGAARDDQTRVMTPSQAIQAGANLLVVGRPILAAENPVAAAEKILQEIEQARLANV